MHLLMWPSRVGLRGVLLHRSGLTMLGPSLRILVRVPAIVPVHACAI